MHVAGHQGWAADRAFVGARTWPKDSDSQGAGESAASQVNAVLVRSRRQPARIGSQRRL